MPASTSGLRGARRAAARLVAAAAIALAMQGCGGCRQKGPMDFDGFRSSDSWSVGDAIEGGGLSLRVERPPAGTLGSVSPTPRMLEIQNAGLHWVPAQPRRCTLKITLRKPYDTLEGGAPTHVFLAVNEPDPKKLTAFDSIGALDKQALGGVQMRVGADAADWPGDGRWAWATLTLTGEISSLRLAGELLWIKEISFTPLEPPPAPAPSP